MLLENETIHHREGKSHERYPEASPASHRRAGRVWSRERAAKVAVYRHGEPVVDAVAGVADPATGRPVASDTPFYAYSTGKGATATVAHVLVERGLFGYDTKIAELWPEFGAHGKESATVRHALTHTLGVPGAPADTTPEDLCDWDKMCEAVADAEPWWAPGTETAYHAYTFGSPDTWALGYNIGRPGADPQETPTVFGWGGAGGSNAYADTATGVAFALTKNRLTPDFGAAEQLSEIVARAVAGS